VVAKSVQELVLALALVSVLELVLRSRKDSRLVLLGRMDLHARRRRA
jgi:hypothetical protein